MDFCICYCFRHRNPSRKRYKDNTSGCLHSVRDSLPFLHSGDGQMGPTRFLQWQLKMEHAGRNAQECPDVLPLSTSAMEVTVLTQTAASVGGSAPSPIGQSSRPGLLKGQSPCLDGLSCLCRPLERPQGPKQMCLS